MCREKDQSTQEYSQRLEEVQGNLKMMERKHFDVSQYVVMMKSQRDEVKNKLFREQIRYQNSVEQLQKLEQEIQELLDLSLIHI